MPSRSSPDGKPLATGSYDQQIKLWNTETGAELRTLTGHNGAVHALAFHPKGRLLASASGDRTVKLWDVDTGERLETFGQPLLDQYTVAFSPDGGQLAGAGVDNRIRIWQISASGKEGTNPMLFAGSRTSTRSSNWPTRPTASCSPRRAKTARSRSGMPPRWSSSNRWSASQTPRRRWRFCRAAARSSSGGWMERWRYTMRLTENGSHQRRVALAPSLATGSSVLVPRLCLGTHCRHGSAVRYRVRRHATATGRRGRASSSVRSQAEPGNEN